MRSILVFIIALFFLGIVSAEDRISSDLQKKLDNVRSNEKISVLVLFEGLPSFDEVAEEYRFLGDSEIVREQVVRVMQEKAENLHHWMKDRCESGDLCSQVADFQSIWIANAVAMKATPDAIREIARESNVEKVVLDEPVPMLVENRGVAWGVEKIKAPQVWQYHTGKGVTVAVIDTGVNEHPDLAGRVKDGKNYVQVGQPPRDDHYHGTHCAGSVAGNGKMGTKTGVAPDATIYAIKVLGANGSGQWSNLWNAIEDSIGKAKVLSMSLGGTASDDIKKRLQAACKNAIAAGVIPVIAAGNSGPNAKTVGSPGDVVEVITVGATDTSDKIASFSSRGPVVWDGKEYVKPDVSAPGVNVVSCSNTGSGYKTLSGTSMATPHVAGLVALMVQAKPNIDNEQAKSVLEKTATDLGTPGKDNIFGAGRVNADKAVQSTQSISQLERSERWEMVVKKLSFKTTVDAQGNMFMQESVPNDLMPGTVTIWVQMREESARKGVYHVSFSLKGPNGEKTGIAKVDYNNIPTDPNKYDAKYGFNVGNFDLVKGDYTGTVKSIDPNPEVKNMTINVEDRKSVV